MGSITDWKIRTFQKETGIQPATGAEAELLEAVSKQGAVLHHAHAHAWGGMHLGMYIPNIRRAAP